MKRIIALSCILWFVVLLMPVLIIRGVEAYSMDGLSAPDTGDATTAAEDDQSVYESAVAAATTDLKPVGSSLDSSVTVTVLIDGEVRSLTLDTYLAGVLAAEMPASFPLEALKAQTVAARSYVMQKKAAYEKSGTLPESHRGALLCDDPSHCSAYIDLDTEASEVFGTDAEEFTALFRQAVRETDGVIAVYEGEPIIAAFHAISGGETESASDVWGTDIPYLTNVESPGEEDAAKFNAEVTLPATEFAERFSKAHPDADLSGEASTWFANSVRSAAGGVITVYVGGVQVTGRDIRSLLGLQSTDFTVAVTESDDGTRQMTFHTTGYGHGVGMSQYGARYMALSGCTYEEIIKWYYPGVELTTMTS